MGLREGDEVTAAIRLAQQMTVEPSDVSAAAIVRAWIESPPLVSWLGSVATGLLFAAFAAIMLAAGLYGALFVARLLRKANAQQFVEKPLLGFIRGKLPGGAEWELGPGVREQLPRFDAETLDALRALNERVGALEKSVQRTEDQIGRMEDISGRLHP